MVDTLNHWADLLKAGAHLGWEAVWAMFAIAAVIWAFRALAFARGKKPKKKLGKRFGLFQVHRSINTERKISLARRSKLGLMSDGDDDTVLDLTADGADSTAAKVTVKAPATATSAVKRQLLAAVSALAISAPEPVCCEKPAVTKEEIAALKAKAEASTLPVAVIVINNDVMAGQRQFFAKCVDEIIYNRTKFAYVVVVASSPGGGVSQYGLMHAEMKRLRLRSCLYIKGIADTVAASGGIMQLAAVHEIIAPPYSMVGSIGVVSSFPNFADLFEWLGIRYVQIFAGKFKRTTGQYTKVTDEDLAHDKAQLEAIHKMFIGSVKEFRPDIDEDKVCNGDHWLAQQSVDEGLGLVDRLATSQEVLFEANQTHDLIFFHEDVNPWEKSVFRFLTKATVAVLNGVLWRAHVS